MPFQCSICGEESTRICARCTKDACDNHLCEKCLRCSDCCECEVRLNAPAVEAARASEPAGHLPIQPADAEAAAAEAAVEPTPAGPEGYLPLL
jgi:hypothetical protein